MSPPTAIIVVSCLVFTSAGPAQTTSAHAGKPPTASAPATGQAEAASRPASAPTAEGVPVGKVTYLDTAVASHDQDNVVVRGAFEITGRPNRWYGVYFTLMLDANTPLKLEGRDFQKLWNNLFMPDPGAARWSDVRQAFSLRDIESANLPKGKRTILWAAAGIWDYDAQKYVEGGWDARTPIIVTTDQAGKIAATETFNTRPANPAENDPWGKIRGRECELALKHLVLKTGARLYQTYGSKNDPHEVLVLGDRQGYFHHDNRGWFFERIDTPEKARELAQLPFGGCTILKTQEQYQAVADAVKALGWKPGRDMLAENPPEYGMTVTEVPELGYRVRMLVLDHYVAYREGFGGVFHREFNVTADGRMGFQATAYITAPQLPISIPPDWTQPLPAGPEKYDEAIKGVLKANATETIPAFVTVSGRTATIPCRKGEDPSSYKDPVQR